MKRIAFWSLVGLLLFYRPTLAQDRNAARERIESAKIGFITNRLSLTSEQATKFWPVYNEYNDKKQEIRKSLRAYRKDSTNPSATDDQLIAGMKDMINLKQKEVDLDKEYMNKFLKVINAHQLAELYKTEQDFKEELLKTLRNRQVMRREPR